MINREKEISYVKKLIRKFIKHADSGIYFCRNIVNDKTETLFVGKYIRLDICYDYHYYEVFGLTEDEEERIGAYYYSLFKEE